MKCLMHFKNKVYIINCSYFSKYIFLLFVIHTFMPTIINLCYHVSLKRIWYQNKTLFQSPTQLRELTRSPLQPSLTLLSYSRLLSQIKFKLLRKTASTWKVNRKAINCLWRRLVITHVPQAIHQLLVFWPRP